MGPADEETDGNEDVTESPSRLDETLAEECSSMEQTEEVVSRLCDEDCFAVGTLRAMLLLLVLLVLLV